jgi:hypothetical protein
VRPPGPIQAYRGALVAVRAGHRDIAAEAEDVIELQVVGKKPVEFLVAEAAIGHDAHLEARRQGVREANKCLVFILIAMVLERGGRDRQPHRRAGAAVPGHERQHDGGLAIRVEVVQFIATLMLGRGPTTEGTQWRSVASISIPSLDSSRSTCLMACLVTKPRAGASP